MQNAKCKIGQTQSANQSFQFSIWPGQVCKPVIKIGQTQSANQSFQFSIWPEQVCKPVDKSAKQRSSFLILHFTWISTKQCTHHSSPAMAHSAALISKLSFFFRSFEFSFKPSFQINPASSHVISCHLSNFAQQVLQFFNLYDSHLFLLHCPAALPQSSTSPPSSYTPPSCSPFHFQSSPFLFLLSLWRVTIINADKADSYHPVQGQQGPWLAQRPWP